MSTSFPMLTILPPVVLTNSYRKAVSRRKDFIAGYTDHNLTLQVDKSSIKLQFLKTSSSWYCLNIYCYTDISSRLSGEE